MTTMGRSHKTQGLRKHSTKLYRTAGIVGVIGLGCLILSGILIVSRETRSDSAINKHRERRAVETNSSSKTSKVDPCGFSTEATRSGLPEFLSKIKRSYVASYPFITIYMSHMTPEEKRRAYRPYLPTPAKLKAISDTSTALAGELRRMSVDKKRLKKRERRIMAQAEYFLSYQYGSPYIDNYYSGAWMLGPARQCSNEGIAYIKVQVATIFLFFQPVTAADLERVLHSFKTTGQGITQYENNVRRGVTAGMVRSLDECRNGRRCLESIYPAVAENLSPDAILRWINPGDYILNITSFFAGLRNNNNEVLSWKRKHRESFLESLRRSLVQDIGKPLAHLLRYLRYEHSMYCVPDGVISGMSSRPLQYVYYNGSRTGKRTMPQLPDGEITRGADTYEIVLAYFTTLPHSAEEVHQMGWRMVKSLYSEAVNVAKNITGLANETEAVEAFKRHINRPEMFFNQKPFPANESDARAHSKCRTLASARKFCPVRYATMLKWFKVARQAILYIKPKLLPLFHHSGPKKSTPSCPVSLGISFDPAQGVQSYTASQSWCPNPARYYMPFFVDRMGPWYAEWAVSAHEANPGHHLQIQGYMENFRDLCESSLDLLERQQYTAFSEGWAMFAENPITTMDTDVFKGHPLEWYGMVKAQLWRALRLVVDTGLHYKQMSRDQAKALFKQYLWDDSDVIDKEITRYQSWPGQAVTYMTGQLAIWEIRKEAQSRLGDRFDMKDFHYHVLSQGEVPMTYVKEHVRHYIACALDASGEGCRDILDVGRNAKTKEASRQWAKQERELKEIWRIKKVLARSHH